MKRKSKRKPDLKAANVPAGAGQAYCLEDPDGRLLLSYLHDTVAKVRRDAELSLVIEGLRANPTWRQLAALRWKVVKVEVSKVAPQLVPMDRMKWPPNKAKPLLRPRHGQVIYAAEVSENVDGVFSVRVGQARVLRILKYHFSPIRRLYLQPMGRKADYEATFANLSISCDGRLFEGSFHRFSSSRIGALRLLERELADDLTRTREALAKTTENLAHEHKRLALVTKRISEVQAHQREVVRLKAGRRRSGALK